MLWAMTKSIASMSSMCDTEAVWIQQVALPLCLFEFPGLVRRCERKFKPDPANIRQEEDIAVPSVDIHL